MPELHQAMSNGQVLSFSFQMERVSLPGGHTSSALPRCHIRQTTRFRLMEDRLPRKPPTHSIVPQSTDPCWPLHVDIGAMPPMTHVRAEP